MLGVPTSFAPDEREEIPKTNRIKIQPSDATNYDSFMNIEERLRRLFAASPEQVRAIDSILELVVQAKPIVKPDPLLLGMTASAKLLGVSRATLWRMIKGGFLRKVEVLPGSFRIRRADLEAIAAGQIKIEAQ